MGDFSQNSISSMQHIASFVVPHRFQNKVQSATSHPCAVVAIIPSFKPGPLTVKLVSDLLRWNDELCIYVVDDCTPESYEHEYAYFASIAKMSDRVTLLRTPVNKMKAGAINYALFSMRDAGVRPDIILTLDDDVVVDRNTVKALVHGVLSDERIGAACSQCRVLNKNANFLTRLQGLEYLGFNATRLADEGFFYGPLVMHGMLTAFRADVLYAVGGFKEGHLIEDYEITSRIKSLGWHVRLAPHAYAWTEVPARFSHLWRQRTRWVYGGVTVVSEMKFAPGIIQDIIGHVMFVGTLFLIIVSYMFAERGVMSHVIFQCIIALSLAQVILWYSFQLWLMKFYADKDRIDWLLRISLVPEFIYANLLTLVLLGSYLFWLFNVVSVSIPDTSFMRGLRKMFLKVGYTKGWGTRSG